MKITVKQDGKDKIFTLGEIKGSTYRKFLEIRDILLETDRSNAEYTVEHFDMMVEFLVKCFGNQFTADELLDSVDIWDINIYVAEVQKYINEKTASKMKKLSKN